MLALCSTALVTAAPVQAAAASTAAPVPPIEFTQRTLKNGLKVIAIRDTTTPNVMTSLWYEVGSKHDPEGRSGFAHLFEHILSRKTVNMPYNEINRMVDDVGGTRNASTWYDRTNYYEIVPAEYLERMLWTHAERMARPVVDQEVFETERNVVKEELRQRVLAPPYGRLFAFAFGENIYNILPHRRPTIGSIEDLDSATLEDARAFHEAYYGPDTATLIVAGNFDPAKLTALVDRYFGSDQAAAPQDSARDHDQGQADHGAHRCLQAARTLPLPAVAVGIPDPRRQPSRPARDRGAESILARGNHNRLDTALVKTGLATEVGSDFNDTEEQGYLALYAFAAGGKQPDAVAGALAGRDRPVAAVWTDGGRAVRSEERIAGGGARGARDLLGPRVRAWRGAGPHRRSQGGRQKTGGDIGGDGRRCPAGCANLSEPRAPAGFHLHPGQRRPQAMGQPGAAAGIQVGPARGRAREPVARRKPSAIRRRHRATRPQLRSRNSPTPRLAMACGSSRPGPAKFRCRR